MVDLKEILQSKDAGASPLRKDEDVVCIKQVARCGRNGRERVKFPLSLKVMKVEAQDFKCYDE